MKPENINFSQAQESVESNVHYTIEKEFFKIKVPENIKADSLKPLIDVLILRSEKSITLNAFTSLVTLLICDTISTALH